MEAKHLLLAAAAVVAAAALVIVMLPSDGGDLGIVYDPGEGECSIDGGRYSDGDTAEVRFEPAPVRPGYIFAGWSLNEDLSTLDFHPGYASNSVTFSGEDIVLHAVYMHDASYLKAGSSLTMGVEAEVQGDTGAEAVGGIAMSVTDHGDRGSTYTWEYSLDIVSGLKGFSGTSGSFTVTPGELAEPWGTVRDVQVSTHVHDGREIPAAVMTYQVEDPYTYVYVVYGLADGIPYEVGVDYDEGALMGGVRATFTLETCDLEYADARNGGFTVSYDAGSGFSMVGDGRTYSDGDTADVRFSPMPYLYGQTFAGWSEDPDADIPDYDTIGGAHTIRINGDITLYAVYVTDSYFMKAGSWFDYEATTTNPDDPGFLYVEKQRQELVDISDGKSVYHVTGTYEATSGGKTETGRIDYTYDSAEVPGGGYSSYGYTDVYVYGGKERPVNVDVVTYESGDVYTLVTDAYSGLAYETVYETEDPQHGPSKTVSKLTGYQILV